MRFEHAWLLVLALGPAGCVEPTVRDAAASSVLDAGSRPPEPTACEWRVSDAVVFAAGLEDYNDIAGAAHLTRDEVFVQVLPSPGPVAHGARIALGETPRILEEVHGEGFGPLFGSTEDGYLRLGACAPTYFDHELDEVSTESWGSRSCRSFQSQAGLLTVAHLDWDTWELRFERRELAPWAIGEPIGISDIDVNTVDSFIHDPEGGTLVFHYDDDGVRWVARPFSGTPPVLLGEVIVRHPALDPVHGGVLQLASGFGSTATRTMRLEHYAWDAGGPDQVLVEVEGQPAGPLVTTETEALATLTDGRILVVPLDVPEARWIGPLEPTGVAYPRLVMRPGESVGGVIYLRRVSERYEAVFRSLTCERG